MELNLLSQLSAGADSLFQLNHLLILLIAIILGLFVGALPGFTASNATAILLPLSIGLGPVGSVIFIGAIYSACSYGGSIPAILFKTPGTPEAGATLLDGWPMTQKGKSDFALGLSLGSSIWGGLIAAVLVILIISPMTELALKFGPAEMFLLALLGISVISSISDSSLAKGLLAGGIGLLISAMSADPTWAQTRLSFGFVELYDEVPFIPALIGLFAIPTMLTLVRRDKISDTDNEVKGKGIGFSGVWKGILESWKRPIANLRSSLIGFFIGVIPGLGSTIGTFISYGQGKLWTKSPETYGKGNPDGVISAEAANNACAPGAIVPTMTLGIPGSGTTAVLLAAIMMHGIVPGPNVIRDYPDITFALLLTLLLSPLVFFPLGAIFNKYAIRFTTLNTAILVPSLVMLSMIGSYAIRSFVFDLFVMLIFALIGILMNRTGYPIIALILGIILGPIAEGNVTRAIRISRGDFSIFFSSTLTIILWVAIFTVIIMSVILEIRKKKIKGVSF